MSRFVLISGCSGGGKSTLLTALAARGHAVVPEPGRRVLAVGGPKPLEDMTGFATAALQMAQQDLTAQAAQDGWVFFDRGVIDAAVALAHCTGTPVAQHLPGPRAYHRTVFLAPPWPEIYRQDAARQHGFDAACAEYERLSTALPALGYDTVLLPKASPETRVDVILDHLA
ncbi:AAA family ATPase [uncultured Roseobacter sp.]|uniref:AAA family ATPase n=1 Tax=uncultured Roseobacter sp. TaxID=114847 RepID=UPI00262E79E4|nr:AAA family ATPase [uncultured Roseobacter sp.]